MASITTAAVQSQISALSFLKIPIKSHVSPSFLSVIERKRHAWVPLQRLNVIKASAGSGTPAAGMYSAHELELTHQNVDTVLGEVRPYLIADGGNVDVVSVEDGVISLKLQGLAQVHVGLVLASSTTTMKMGIERMLKEKFGDAVKDICKVYDEQISGMTVEAVNGHLDILRPAIKIFGGIVEVLSVEGGDCLVKYEGPESIGSGIKAAIREKFPDIANVVFSS